MEGGKGLKATCLIAMLMLAMFAGQTEASYQTEGFSMMCYGMCMLKCTLSFKVPMLCAGFCVVNCIKKKPKPPSTTAQISAISSSDEELHYYCKLGCATSKCAKISTSPQDIRGDEVKECVNDCDNQCITKLPN